MTWLRHGWWLAAALIVLAAALLLLPADPVAALQSEPLPPRAAGEGPLFERVPPEQSGLEFTHLLEPHNAYPYVNNGSGLAVGDVDGDGLPDLYLVSSDGPNRLFRQVAPLRFRDVTASAGVDGGEAWGTGATFVDVDGDGDLDLYVCNLEAPNLLYRNRGDGTFEECAAELGLDFAGATEMAAFADYDRDGDLDVYLLTNRVFTGNLPRELLADVRPPAATRKTPAEMLPVLEGVQKQGEGWHIPPSAREFLFAMQDNVYFGGQSDRLLRNVGGRFHDISAAAGIADHGMGLSATWWDYDGDGWLDLYVANDLESPDLLYHNNGDGTFTERSRELLPSIPYYGMGADFGDIDGDGRFDLIVADMMGSSHDKELRLLDGIGPRRWVMENARPPQYMRNHLFVNTGAGRFLEVAFLAGIAATDWTWTVKLGDLDNDGRLDLYATNGVPRFDMDPDLVPRLRGMSHDMQMTVARRIPPLPETNFAFRNAGELRFDDVGRAWGLADEGVTQAAAFSDLDRDGDLDIVAHNFNGPVWLYRNRGAAGHRILVRLRGRDGNRDGVGAVVTAFTETGHHVRQLTLARGYMTGDEPLLHFGLGDQDTVLRLQVRWPRGTVQEFEDLSADRLYTIHEPEWRPPPAPVEQSVEQPAEQRPLFTSAAATGLRFRHRERPFDDYGAQPLLPHRLSLLGPGLAWGDADGDGDEDLFVGGAAGQAGALYRNAGDGSFHAEADDPWLAHADSEDLGALWFDADGDGDQDLYVVSGGVESEAGDRRYADRLYRNEGSSGFQSIRLETADSGSCVAAADFDRDGDLDLFVGARVVPGHFPHSPGSRLLRNDGGSLEDVTAELAPDLQEAGMVTAALWSDADGDGWLDLLVAAHWRPVVMYRNDSHAGFAPPVALSPETGWWNGIVGADFDGDGDIDYAVTNFGLNGKYRADPQQPATLFAADFDEDGVLDLVEAGYADDVLVPLRGRHASSNAMPFLADKFPTFQGFATASLEKIYGADALASALRLQATELRSGLLRNDGNGNFAFEPLPRRAQVAPSFGAVAADFDGDGDPDLYLAQNSYSPEPETGRMAGGVGLLLRNDGEAGWLPVPPLASGLVVPGDAKALTVCDLDGDPRPDLLVAVNDGLLRAFRNEAAPPDRYLVVQLQGPRGNPTAVGARVTLTTGDGRHRVAEVHAGSGYLAQSSSSLWFGLGNAPVAAIEVRWPDGEITTLTEVPASGRRVILRR